MKIYHIEPDAIKLQLRNFFWNRISYSLLGLALILGYLFYSGQLKEIPLIYISGLIVIILGVDIFTRLSQVKKSKSVFKSYQIILEEESITRKQAKLDDLKIRKDEITSIKETEKGEIYILTDDKFRFIYVNPGMENLQELRAWLSTWKIIEPMEKTEMSTWITALIVIVGSDLIFHLSNDGRIAIPAGIVCIAVSIYYLTIIQRSRHRSRSFKLLLWFATIFIILTALLRFYRLLKSGVTHF